MNNTIDLMIYSEKKVIEITGLSRSTIYRSTKTGIFPKAKQLSGRRKGYLAKDIYSWIASRKAA
jgi:predicted DNA-binding transcriptional regulator AlpA